MQETRNQRGQGWGRRFGSEGSGNIVEVSGLWQVRYLRKRRYMVRSFRKGSSTTDCCDCLTP